MKTRELDWLPVPGFEGWYEINPAGQVKRVKLSSGAVAGRILRWGFDGDGYPSVSLGDGTGRFRRIKIHILVARTFLGERPSSSHQVNHKDGDKANARVENLEWVTAKENRRHAYRIGLQSGRKGEANSLATLTNQDVREIRAIYSGGGISQREIGEQFGVSQSRISWIITRKCWQHVV